MRATSRTPRVVKRAMSGLHVFYLYVLGILFFNFDAKPVVHSINKIMVMFELLNVEAMYEAPLVEIIEVQVEKGFVISPTNDGNLSDYGNNGTV